MSILLRLSFRNIFRQKRRNLLLGIGIAFGMMIFVIANSFSHGMVDVLINDVVSYTFGHLVIQSTVGVDDSTIVPDKAMIEKIIRKNVKKADLLYMGENLGIYGQAIGKGEADNVVIMGVSVKTASEKKMFFENFFTLVQGNFNDYFRNDIQYPVIISEKEAQSLNVKLNDDIRIRFTMVTGQINTAKLDVIAIARPNNSFMDMVLFMDGEKVKKLLGYKPWESANLQLTLKNPQVNAEKYANIIHQKLNPKIIVIPGHIGSQECRILAFKNDDRSKDILKNQIKIVQGNLNNGLAEYGVMISRQLARKLHLNVGDVLHYQYQTRFLGLHEEDLIINAIYDSNMKLGNDIILVNGEKIYKIYDRYLPFRNDWQYVSKKESFYPVLATEWKLLDRSQDSDSLQQKYDEEHKIRTDQIKMDVVTMYEGASDILKFEGVLNLITTITFMVLFFIILIGVMNTLRMTIKERTREIGTTRAIGMQKKDIQNEFILETLWLTILSCGVGIIAGILVMQVLSMFSFNSASSLNIILKNKHLFFKLYPVDICKNLILILVITTVTAYLPAKRAADLVVVEALKHYE